MLSVMKVFKCYNKRTKKIIECSNVNIDELLEKSSKSSKSELEKDKERLVFIEPEVQKTDEKKVAEIGAQPINVESDEEDEEHEARSTTPEPVIPRYVRLNH